jgi:hypothetical protein
LADVKAFGGFGKAAGLGDGVEEGKVVVVHIALKRENVKRD